MKFFLSHIHEEKEMALLMKSAVESEFSGFVEVFVSSIKAIKAIKGSECLILETFLTKPTVVVTQ